MLNLCAIEHGVAFAESHAGLALGGAQIAAQVRQRGHGLDRHVAQIRVNILVQKPEAR